MSGEHPWGHDGPYPAPVTVSDQIVQRAWIDYNGHMNVGYYGIAFDQAIDQVFDTHLGCGEAYVASVKQGPYVLQSHIQFLNELKEGQTFSVCFRLLDHDHKRVHFFGELISGGTVCATQEVLAMNVDHATGKSCDYPQWLQGRLSRMRSDHADLPVPKQVGATLGIRR